MYRDIVTTSILLILVNKDLGTSSKLLRSFVGVQLCIRPYDGDNDRVPYFCRQVRWLQDHAGDEFFQLL